MIHPINLPEELLAANPTRPTLIELRRKPRITYTADGRRLRNGLPTTPQTPTNLWASTFVRGFVHRIAYDARVEAEETSSAESLIDIVDLHPPNEIGHDHEAVRNAIPLSEGHNDEVPTLRNVVPDRCDPSECRQNDEILPMNIHRQSSAQFKMPIRGSIVDHDVISPILQPCCSSTELNHLHLKEFVRFDFSNTAFFHAEVNPSTDSLTGDVTDSQRPSMTLVPHSIGSRIWLNKPVSLRPVSRAQLCFAVKSVKVENGVLVITMTVRNTHAQALSLETEVHVHVAHAQTIGRLVLSQTYSFSLSDENEHDLSLHIDLSSPELVNCALQSDEYIVITLLGFATPVD